MHCRFESYLICSGSGFDRVNPSIAFFLSRLSLRFLHRGRKHRLPPSDAPLFSIPGTCFLDQVTPLWPFSPAGSRRQYLGADCQPLGAGQSPPCPDGLPLTIRTVL